jgi:acetylglutamate kinase
MEHALDAYIQKAGVLIEALPYIREFEGKTAVIKYGGAAMLDPRLRESTAEDIVLMKYVGINPVIVHGGGPEISRTLKQLGIESAFHEGLRITDDAAIRVVEMVLAGTVNKEIVTLINRAGGNGAGLCGKDGNLLHARRIQLEDGVDLGHVGEIDKVREHIVRVLAEAGMIPVIAPIATDASGGTWNVNADTAAGEIAAALKAEKLVFLTDTPGVLRSTGDETSLMHQVAYEEIQKLKQEGTIGGGMIPKVDACLRALEQGVRKTHIVDGRVPHALLLEIFTTKGLGTLITR